MSDDKDLTTIYHITLKEMNMIRQHTHDLQNHLGAILGYSRLLKEDDKNNNEKTELFIDSLLQATNMAIDSASTIQDIHRYWADKDSTVSEFSTEELSSIKEQFLNHFEESEEFEELENNSLENLMGCESILYIEDDRSFGEMIKLFFTELGYEVSIAEDGKKALIAIQEDEFDLVICDYQLPHKNGLKVLTEIREKLPKIRLILVSGNKLNLEDSEVTQLQLSTFFKKPFVLQEFATGLRKILDAAPLTTLF